jgi:transcriptional regulator with XRE-family HTH domain
VEDQPEAENNTRKLFGKLLKKFREARGLTQGNLAMQVQYHNYKTISEIENGRKLPPYQKYQWIYQTLNLSEEEGEQLDKAYLGRSERLWVTSRLQSTPQSDTGVGVAMTCN